MRKLAIAVALASTALATPAVARDDSAYVGLEGGVLWVEDMDVDFRDETGFELADAFTLRHKAGFDIGLIAGYDFGMIRAELELAYKRASLNEASASQLFPGPGSPGDNFEADGRARTTSGMINALLDFGNEDGLSGYAGAGIGLAQVRYSADIDTLGYDFSDSYSGLAWQGILGARYAVSPNLDLGLKYRFFNVPNVKFTDNDDLLDSRLKGKWRSHSLLASVIYNFFAAPPPPPPPAPVVVAPPPPATQTCPDGSVILATEVCPAPPPPPPPPPPEPVRG